jgi:hypothetical protein
MYFLFLETVEKVLLFKMDFRIQIHNRFSCSSNIILFFKGFPK